MDNDYQFKLQSGLFMSYKGKFTDTSCSKYLLESNHFPNIDLLCPCIFVPHYCLCEASFLYLV